MKLKPRVEDKASVLDEVLKETRKLVKVLFTVSANIACGAVQ